MDAPTQLLSEAYPQEIRFLTERDPFRFLISVILSAQTTDKKVNAVAQELFSLYPDAASLARAPQEKVEEIIHPLGFFRMKAQNIIATSKEIERRGGVPEAMEELVTLPGVGRKTANCFRGDILHLPAIIVDTHFARVSYRLGYTQSKDPVTVENDIKARFSPEEWYRISMVLNYHGRAVCFAKKPNCAECQVRSLCPKDGV